MRLRRSWPTYSFLDMKKITSFVAVLITAGSFHASALAEEADSVKVSEFTYEYAKPWIRQQPRSSMRAAQFLYDHEDEALKDVELVLFYFGKGQGGNKQANIDRWVGQFDGTPTVEQKDEEMEGKTITLLEAKGTYMDGPPFGGNKTPRPDYTMLAAIMPSPEGDVFLKMTGPNDSMAAAKEAFLAFVKSGVTK